MRPGNERSMAILRTLLLKSLTKKAASKRGGAPLPSCDLYSRHRKQKRLPSPTIILVCGCIALAAVPWFVYLRHPEVALNPALFLTEYLKFGGTLLAATLGWFLVHVLWSGHQQSSRQTAFRLLVLAIMDRLIRINLETMEMLDSSYTKQSLEARDKYVEANINRHVDILDTLKALAEDYHRFAPPDPILSHALRSFLSSSSVSLTQVLAQPYNHLRSITPESQECLASIGRDLALLQHSLGGLPRAEKNT